MVYYDENDNIIDESQVDLAHGYLTDRTIEHHDEVAEVYHYVESDPLPSGATMKKKVVDVPFQHAWDEVTSQTYHFTGPTPEEILRSDVDKLMHIGEVYRTSFDVAGSDFVYAGTVALESGVYELTGSADEYKAVVGYDEVTGDIVLPEAIAVNIFAKSDTPGTHIAIVLKK